MRPGRRQEGLRLLTARTLLLAKGRGNRRLAEPMGEKGGVLGRTGSYRRYGLTR